MAELLYLTELLGLRVFDLKGRNYAVEPESPKAINLARLRKAGKVVRSNPGASLLDLGDGVACLEFHTKMNVIGGDQLGMLAQSLEEVRKNFVGLVIGNQGPHFSAGANILMLLTQIQNEDWDEVDQSIRLFQKATSTLRQFEKPVVNLGAHVASLGMRFYTGTAFPNQYKNQIFIAEHGSWNRSLRAGYQVAFVAFKDGQPSADPVPFMTGLVPDPSSGTVYGRPVGVAVAPDGSLLVSDDGAALIYRISVDH